MSLAAMKAQAMLDNKASRALWAIDLHRDAKAVEISAPLSSVVAEVVAEVSAVTGILSPEIRGKSRNRSVVRARHFAWYKLREFGLTSTEIADAFGVDHSSVLTGAAKFAKILQPFKKERKA